MTVPSTVLEAVGLPPTARVEATTGATGELWKVGTDEGTYALRLAPSRAAVEGMLAAMAAGRGGGLPVPGLVRQADWPGGHALLFEWLAGVSVPDCFLRDPAPAVAHAIGRLMGEAQRTLHAIRAPEGVPNVKANTFGPPTHPLDSSQLPGGDTLLHLDLHPLNVLVENGRLSAVLDWDNARAGHPLADLARTYTLFHVDPAIARRTPEERDLLRELVQGWADGYGAQASAIPAACLAWAGRAMLRDLARRYDDTEFAKLRAWTAEQERVVDA